MNLRLSFVAAALVAAASCCSSFAQSVAPAQPPPAPPPPPSVPPDQMLEAYGWIMGQELQLFGLGFSDAEFQAFARGMARASKGEKAYQDMQDRVGALQNFMTSRPQEVQEKRAASNREEEQKFLQQLDAKPEVKKTESGLRYEIVTEGSGAKPALDDSVVAHYTGTFVDGTVFDSSRERGEPAEFALKQVIAGWQEGVRLIAPGGRIKLYVPAKLGYGDAGGRTMPPAKFLVFDVELLEVKPAAPAQPTLAPQPSQPQLIP